jgi:hypothetical protein
MDVDLLRARIYLEWERGYGEVHQAVVDDLLPLARRLRVVPRDESLESIVLRMLDGNFEIPEADPEHPVPKKLAAIAFWGMLSGLLIGAMQRESQQNDDEQVRRTIGLLPEVRGYLRAMCDVQGLRTNSGAVGRRKVGEASKVKVMAAVQPYLGRISKEQAAHIICEQVHMSSATVRVMLTKLYPGEAWSKRESSESVDSS